MFNFYFYAILLLLLAAGFTCYPLIRAKRKQGVQLSNASIIKQRICELQREVNEGLLDETDREEAIKDLKVALVDESVVLQKNESNTGFTTVIILALPALIIGTLVYWHANQLNGLSNLVGIQAEAELIRQEMQKNGTKNLTGEDFAKLALSVRTSLREQPDDVEGWTSLGLLNSSIGRYEEALAAYEKALDLTPQDDALRFKYAEILMFSGTEEGMSNARRQLAFLISRNPTNRNYRLLMTAVAIQLQDAQLAKYSFDLIKDNINPNSSFYKTMARGLASLGIDVITDTPTANSLNEGSNKSANANEVEIQINIDISQSLRDKVPPQGFLIVFAQNGNGQSRAPLAVKRMSIPELPAKVTLSNSDSMIAGMNLSSAQTLKLTARISADQDVMPSAGELQGQLLNIDMAILGEQPLSLIINEEL